jgi:hypothetical protein
MGQVEARWLQSSSVSPSVDGRSGQPAGVGKAFACSPAGGRRWRSCIGDARVRKDQELAGLDPVDVWRATYPLRGRPCLAACALLACVSRRGRLPGRRCTAFTLREASRATRRRHRGVLLVVYGPAESLSNPAAEAVTTKQPAPRFFMPGSTACRSTCPDSPPKILPVADRQGPCRR